MPELQTSVSLIWVGAGRAVPSKSAHQTVPVGIGQCWAYAGLGPTVDAVELVSSRQVRCAHQVITASYGPRHRCSCGFGAVARQAVHYRRIVEKGLEILVAE